MPSDNESPNIQLHYCSGIQNFGDELSPYLLEKITGRKVVSARSSNGLYAVGSLLTWDVLHSGCVVWGSGTLQHDAMRMLPRPFPLKRSIPTLMRRISETKQPLADIRAVRGILTRDAIIRAGGKAPEIYGDPAILLPRYYAPSPDKQYDAGIILHHTQEEQNVVKQLQNFGVRLISIRRIGSEQIERFVDEVCSCRKIFSASLHGLIVAQAYGIPAQWIQIKDKSIHRDACHKFFNNFSD